ncbi:GNAT family N-acetyltransferase [Paenibacillus profundus]|uniref:GNAT family N-acetyltransferase n=1 Tax=Paenibacillus profundus TaxID=1173085 RepID=A0ABS8YLS0_9BACL|nr:GNAT family N-acetyltransferase [Paenibacillus profundus]MCE5171889.1 GNAT family N-acetyltransferase [Paenibacillus profundus]
MKIVKAEQKNVGCLHELYKILIDSIAKKQPLFFHSAEQSRAFISEQISSDKSDFLLVLDEGEIYGFALVVENQTPPYSMFVPHKYAYLMDLVVDPVARGRGYAQELIKACSYWQKERNLDYLELNVLTNNDEALKLYEKMGFKDKDKHMYLV